MSPFKWMTGGINYHSLWQILQTLSVKDENGNTKTKQNKKQRKNPPKLHMLFQVTRRAFKWQIYFTLL